MGSCLVSAVFLHVQSTQKEQINSHKVIAERGCCMKEEDRVAYKVSREWILLENFNNTNDE